MVGGRPGGGRVDREKLELWRETSPLMEGESEGPERVKDGEGKLSGRVTVQGGRIRRS